MNFLKNKKMISLRNFVIKWWQKKPLKIAVIVLSIFLLIVGSNLFLQLAQNSWSLSLAFNFAFSWHTEKFFLACLVLFFLWGFISSVLGSLIYGGLFYSLLIFGIGIVDALKMQYRQEPLYPDDLKMIVEFATLKDIAGWPLFLGFVLLLIAGAGLIIYSIYRSFKKKRSFQIFRGLLFVISFAGLIYASNFNQPSNLLRQAYNKTALWIPYSQKMNYYNTGFIGGFLYNLEIIPMDQPDNYSEATIKEIVEKYTTEQTKSENQEDSPNIIYVMSESFSDTSRLKGITIEGGDPLADYRSVANKTYSGQMLSQNYGGGTANIEFEALTGFSMEMFNAQMTTPYTMLVPNFTEFPSIVNTLSEEGYDTTAIHPYNTSMYKRKSVYQSFGFDQFLDENTMDFTDTIEDNPYISDEAAYQQIMEILNQTDDPQFVHLVTMQTHMPYSNKYANSPYTAIGEDTDAVNNYLQDIAYSSEALNEFLNKVDQLDRRTLVVFWGDHLPGIYSEELQAENEGTTLHETEFLMYDNRHQLENQQDVVTSPFYFAADLFQQAQLPTSGFQQLLLQMQEIMPAFEKQMYYRNGSFRTEKSLNQSQEEIYQAYQLIQYDIVAGKQYSLAENFFRTNN